MKELDIQEQLQREKQADRPSAASDSQQDEQSPDGEADHSDSDSGEAASD